jgi:hypothetical protein
LPDGKKGAMQIYAHADGRRCAVRFRLDSISQITAVPGPPGKWPDGRRIVTEYISVTEIRGWIVDIAEPIESAPPESPQSVTPTVKPAAPTNDGAPLAVFYPPKHEPQRGSHKSWDDMTPAERKASLQAPILAGNEARKESLVTVPKGLPTLRQHMAYQKRQWFIKLMAYHRGNRQAAADAAKCDVSAISKWIKKFRLNPDGSEPAA